MAWNKLSSLKKGGGGGGKGEPVGMSVRNWADEFFLERKVFEGVPRRERLWRARVKGRMGWRTEATQERGLRTWARVGLWMLEW